MAANSLLIVPAGFDPATDFGSYTSQGLIHTAGTTLKLSAGQDFGGIGSIAIRSPAKEPSAASNGAINLNNGLVLSGAGSVNLGNGSLTVNDPTSASAADRSRRQAIRRQWGHGPIHPIRRDRTLTTVFLGYNSADSGTYNLSGTGQLSAPTQYVGYSGTGTFTQSAGTNTAYGNFYLGYNSAPAERTTSTARAHCPRLTQYVGYSGAGTFTQSAGTNSVRTSSTWATTRAAAGRTILTGNGRLSSYYRAVRRLLRHGHLHPVGRSESRTTAISTSATTPAQRHYTP